MARLPQPDLESVEGRAALKSVIKWEIQTLLNRLAETGEEALVLTASLEDDNFTELGSDRGQDFLQLSNLGHVKAQFLTYCKACFAGTDFGDVPPVATTLGAQSLLNSAKRSKHGNKSRKRKHIKLMKQDRDVGVDTDPCLDNPTILQPLGNPDSDPASGDVDSGHVAKDGTHGKSRRKRTPKKLLAASGSYHSNTEDSDNNMADQSCEVNIKQEPVWMDEYEAVKTGSPSSSLLQTQIAQSAGNQSADSDTSSSKDGFQLSPSRPKRMVSILRNFGKPMNSVTGSIGDGGGSRNSSGNLKMKVKRKIRGDKHKKKKKIKQEPASSLLDPALEAGQCEGEEAPSYGGNSKGLQTLLENLKTDFNIDSFTPEDLDLMKFQSPIRPPGKGFKAAASDEQPMETAILDAAKLGVGRYQCLWCALIVRDRHDLKRHLRTHTKSKPYQCVQCQRKFSRKWDLENHLKRHQEESLNEKVLSATPVKMENLSESDLHTIWLENMKSKLDIASVSVNSEEVSNSVNDSAEGDSVPNPVENGLEPKLDIASDDGVDENDAVTDHSNQASVKDGLVSNLDSVSPSDTVVEGTASTHVDDEVDDPSQDEEEENGLLSNDVDLDDSETSASEES